MRTLQHDITDLQRDANDNDNWQTLSHPQNHSNKLISQGRYGAQNKTIQKQIEAPASFVHITNISVSRVGQFLELEIDFRIISIILIEMAGNMLFSRCVGLYIWRIEDGVLYDR